MPLEYMKVGPILVALSSKSRFVVVKVFIGWCYDGGGPEKKNLERCKKSWMRWDQRIGNLDLRRNGHHINWTGCCRQTELFIKFPPGFNQSGNSCTSSECGFCLAQSMLYHIHKAKGECIVRLCNNMLEDIRNLQKQLEFLVSICLKYYRTAVPK